MGADRVVLFGQGRGSRGRQVPRPAGAAKTDPLPMRLDALPMRSVRGAGAAK